MKNKLHKSLSEPDKLPLIAKSRFQEGKKRIFSAESLHHPNRLASLQEGARREAAKRKAYGWINTDGLLTLKFQEKEITPKEEGRRIDLVNIETSTLQALTDSQKIQLLEFAFLEHMIPLAAYLLEEGIAVKRLYVVSRQDLEDLIELDLPQNALRSLASSNNEKHDILKPFATSFSHERASIYQRFIHSGYPITMEFLAYCLHQRNLPLIHFILGKVHRSWLIENSEEILNILLQTEDQSSMELISQCLPEIGSLCPLHVVKNAVEQGSTGFFKWILKHKGQIPNENLTKFLGMALQEYDLELIESICRYAQSKEDETVQFYQKFSYPEVLNINDWIKDYQSKPRRLNNIIYDFIYKCALSSPMTDVYHLLQRFPALIKQLHHIFERLPLLTRMKKMERVKLDYTLNFFLNHASSSALYAMSNAETQKKIHLNLLTRPELIQMLSKNHSKAKKAPTPHAKKKDLLSMRSGFMKHRRSRAKYGLDSCSLNHLSRSFYVPKTNFWRIPHQDCMQFENECRNIRYTYSIPAKGLPEKKPMGLLTRSENTPEMMWSPPPDESYMALEQHMDELYKEIIQFQLVNENPQSRKELDKKIAQMYWLVASLITTAEESSHHAMMIMNALYRHHKIPAPIPTREVSSLYRRIAISDIISAQENWTVCNADNPNGFFEPHWDEALDAVNDKQRKLTIKAWLKINPKLFKFASHAVRMDPDLLNFVQQVEAENEKKIRKTRNG